MGIIQIVLLCATLRAGSFSSVYIPTPALPNVTAGAGTTFVDPTFGSPMVRVTDGETMVGSDATYRNRAYGTGSSSEANIWSVDGTRLLVGMSGGYVLPYTLNGATMATARVADGASIYGGRTIVDMGGEPVMSLADNDLIYGISGMKIRKMIWGTWTAIDLKDFTSLVPDGTVLAGVSSAVNERICTYANQDVAHWVAWFDPAVGTAHVLNTLDNTIDGVSIGIDLSDWAVHNARIEKEGRYITISGAGDIRIWDTQHAANGAISAVLSNSGGHKVAAYGYYLNVDDLPGAYQFQILRRPLNDLATITPLLPLHGAPYTLDADMHPSWNNALADSFKPVYMATYSPTEPGPHQPYMAEIIAVYTDGSKLVERFAHHRSFYSAFEDSPRGNISPDGRFYAFTSNWENSLGTGRQDVFVVATVTTADLRPLVTGRYAGSGRRSIP